MAMVMVPGLSGKRTKSRSGNAKNKQQGNMAIRLRGSAHFGVTESSGLQGNPFCSASSHLPCT